VHLHAPAGVDQTPTFVIARCAKRAASIQRNGFVASLRILTLPNIHRRWPHFPARALRGGPIRGGPAAPRAADRRWWRSALSRARSARPTPGQPGAPETLRGGPIRGGPAAPRAADRRSWRGALSRARSARPTPGQPGAPETLRGGPIRGGPAAPRAADRRWWRGALSRARSARPTPEQPGAPETLRGGPIRGGPAAPRAADRRWWAPGFHRRETGRWGHTHRKTIARNGAIRDAAGHRRPTRGAGREERVVKRAEVVAPPRDQHIRALVGRRVARARPATARGQSEG
jgi:hypothetical protein